MAADAQDALTAALDRMWVQFRPLMIERVDILNSAAGACTPEPLSLDRQQEARAAAHKLAGALGTFGLTRGTELARELEIIYSGPNAPDPSLAERLAAELRTIIDSRK